MTPDCDLCSNAKICKVRDTFSALVVRMPLDLDERTDFFHKLRQFVADECPKWEVQKSGS